MLQGYLFLFFVVLAISKELECSEEGYKKYLDLYPFKTSDPSSSYYKDHLQFFLNNCRQWNYRKGRDGITDITPFIDWSDSELEKLGSLEIFYSHEVELNEPVTLLQKSTQIDKTRRDFPELVEYNNPSEDCPTSWATAIVEVAEAALKNSVKLSARQLLKCLPEKEQLNGCKGVRPKMILKYLLEVGLVEEEKFKDCNSLEGLQHYYFYGELPDVPNASGLMNLIAEKKKPVFVMVALNLVKLRFVKDMSNMDRGMKCGGYEPALYGVVTGYHYDEYDIDNSWWELSSHMIPGEEMILRMPMSTNMENANYAGIAAYAFTLIEVNGVTEEPSVAPSTETPTSDGPTSIGPTTETTTSIGPTSVGPTTETNPTENASTETTPTEIPTTETPTTETTTSIGPTSVGPTSVGPTTETTPTEITTTETAPTETPTSEILITETPTTEASSVPLSTYICSETMYPNINDIPITATKLIFSQSSYPSINSIDFSRFTQLEELVFEDNTFVNCDSLFINNPHLKSIKIGNDCFERDDNGSRRLSDSSGLMSILNGGSLSVFIVGTRSMGNFNKIILEGCMNDVDVDVGYLSFSCVLDNSIVYDTASNSFGLALKMAIGTASDIPSKSVTDYPTDEPTSLVPSESVTETPTVDPTPVVPDYSSNETLVIRTTQYNGYYESFKVYKGDNTTGTLMFTQPSVKDYEVNKWIVRLLPGVYTLEMIDNDDGWSRGSKVEFIWNGITLVKTSLYLSGKQGLYSFIIPDTPPTPSYVDPFTVDISVIRTTTHNSIQESFYIYEGIGKSGILRFSQPSIEDFSVYNWTIHLRPGNNTVELADNSDYNWSDGSRIEFVYGGVTLACVSLSHSSNSYFLLTIPDTIPSPPSIDSSAIEISIIRTTGYYSYGQTFKLYEGEDTSGSPLLSQSSVSDYLSYYWTVHLRPGLYTLEMSGSNGWSDHSRIEFAWNEVTFVSTYLCSGEKGLYSFIIPDTPPTPSYVDPFAVDISVIRTTTHNSIQESFDIYEGRDSYILKYTQPSIEDFSVYNWTIHLRPGEYTVELTDTLGDGWSDGSKIEFVYGGVTLACVSLSHSSNSYFLLTIPDTIPSPPSIDSSAVEISIIRTTVDSAFTESFKLFEGFDDLSLVFSHSGAAGHLSFYWTVYLRPGVYTLIMQNEHYSTGWSDGSRIDFIRNDVIFVTASLEKGTLDLVEFIIRDTAPTQPIDDSVVAEITVIRTTGLVGDEEEYKLYEGEDTSGQLLVEQYNQFSNDVVSSTLRLKPGVYTVEMEDHYGDGWSSGSRIVFVRNGVILGSTSLSSGYDGTYTLTIPDVIPTPPPIDPSAVEISIIRTTGEYYYAESFRLIEGQDGSGDIVFIQPPLKTQQVYTWNVYLRPGVYRIEMTDTGRGWEHGSKVTFIWNNVTIGTASLNNGSFGVSYLTVPDSPPTQSTGDSVVAGVYVIRTTTDSDCESFRLYEGDTTSGSLVYMQDYTLTNDKFHWMIDLHPGVYTVRMEAYFGDGWSDGSKVEFVWNGVILGSTSLSSGYDGTYTLIIPDAIPTPPPIDPSAVEISIVRTTGEYGTAESFRLIEGQDGSGDIVFIQPNVLSNQVYTWTVLLSPGVYRIEMIDFDYNGWDTGSTVSFIWNNVTIATTSLRIGSYGVYNLTIPDTIPTETPTSEASSVPLSTYICSETMYPNINDIPITATKLIFSQSSYPSINSIDFSRFTQLEELVFEDNTFVNCDSLFINNPHLKSIKIGNDCFERDDNGSRRLSDSSGLMSILNGGSLSVFIVGTRSMGNFNRTILEGCMNDVDVDLNRVSFSNMTMNSIYYDTESKRFASNLKIAIEIANIVRTTSNNWAVLVCGSNGYSNYRHHADVAHAYQIMKNGGIPVDHIITLMYNDVPYSSDNPFPGKLFHRPGNDSPNVYEGVIVDYEGDDVSPETLMKVLTGDPTAGGKVLNSTLIDNVFFYYAGSGYGVLSLPNDSLFVDDFIDTIQIMHEKDMYNRLVLYIDSNDAGSLFMDLPIDLDILAVTSSVYEESYSVYCWDEAVVNDEYLGTCLGNEFSVAWMEYVDNGTHYTNTLDDHFYYLVEKVTYSQVSRYGDLSFRNDLIGEFMGYNGTNISSTSPLTLSRSLRSRDDWSSYDNELLFRRYMTQNTIGAEKKRWEAAVEEELASRAKIDEYVANLAKKSKYYNHVSRVKNMECYKKAINQFTAAVGRTDYALKYYSVFASMCNENQNAF